MDGSSTSTMIQSPESQSPPPTLESCYVCSEADSSILAASIPGPRTTPLAASTDLRVQEQIPQKEAAPQEHDTGLYRPNIYERSIISGQAKAHLGHQYSNYHAQSIHFHGEHHHDSPATHGKGADGLIEPKEDIRINKYFDVPKTVHSCYVGRESESETLASAFFSRTEGAQTQQRRFVISGVGGSGKTQFCCKFAHDYQQRYWGVFWVDGRSHDHLKQTLTQNVASIAGVANNHNAALSWLCNHHDSRWLLIIDNADDPDMNLSDYFPKGGNGNVLITTRNPEFSILGNVAPKCLKFAGMKDNEASMLLLKTADIVPSAWEEVKKHAGQIVKPLGYLALAISVAGSAIRKGACKFQDYLTYFNNKIKERLQYNKQTGAVDNFERDREDSVEATFDISLKAIETEGTLASRDALQFLKTFAFLHCENVRFDFIKQCVECAGREKRAESKNNSLVKTEPRSWRRCAFEKLLWLLTLPEKAAVSTILPDVLRQARAKQKLDSRDEGRVRAAMRQLTQYSLVMWNERTDSWSMHPLVHQWARFSINSQIGEQHVWCEAAATLVSSCVLIGPNDEELLKQLLPHVDEVRRSQEDLAKQILDKRLARVSLLPIFDSSFSSQKARMYAKFSLIYAYNGLFEKSEKLQTVVQRFTVAVLGFEDSKTRQITMALARTLWHLSRSNDAAKLLEVLLENCNRVCGENHRDTYIAKLRLAESRIQQGRVPHAKQLCEEALTGLERLAGLEDEETLNTKDVLAVSIILTGTPNAVSKAQQLHRETWSVRERLLGPEDIKTLESRQYYYTTTFWMGDQEEHKKAADGLREIIDIRRRRQGREHPLTLQAMLYLARILIEIGEFEEAQTVFDQGLPVGKRDYGENHIAVLFCRYLYARLKARQGFWREARNILIDVTERQRTALQGWGRYHYDRIGALLELARAHHELGEHEECDQAVEEAIRGFERITTNVHPWHEKLMADWEGWKRTRSSFAPVDRSECAKAQAVPLFPRSTKTWPE
ncbi:hypothetical protein CLAFUR4_14082 [Fulvia fulva]|nr:hypothetical protein CLAFUR4_14082 [Fulvia fulva]